MMHSNPSRESSVDSNESAIDQLLNTSLTDQNEIVHLTASEINSINNLSTEFPVNSIQRSMCESTSGVSCTLESDLFTSNRIDDCETDNTRAVAEESKSNSNNISEISNVSNNVVFDGSENEERSQADDSSENAIPEEFESNADLSQLLCNSLDCTRGEVLLMAMTIGMRHSLTWEAIVDILKMVNAIFGEKVVHDSKYFLHKFFPSNIANGVYHIYCPQCHRYVGIRNNLENNICCPCGYTMDISTTSSYFLQFDVRSQLKHFFDNPKFRNNLNYRYTRVKINNAALEDIFDGLMYQQKAHLFIDNPNISYTFNTDGCQAADSSNTTVWPIYMMLHDLPPAERKKYMILAGLWVDRIEPKMNIFLESFVSQANDLSSSGITWKLGDRQITSRLIPLICPVDSVARCKMLNMKQYNGFFGCTFCMHPTETVDRQRCYTVTKKIPALRTDSSIKSMMLEASNIRQLDTSVFGVMGASSLMNLHHFDLGEGMVVDDLHAAFLGVARKFTEIILSAVGEEYYVGTPSRLSRINRRLLHFCPPTVISRTPRSLDERRNWKGSEWQNWTILYSLICLKGILEKKYFEHWALFVAAINILLQNSIVEESLKDAEVLLIRFVVGFQELYGKRAMSYNIHLLLHICRSVRNWGPLWTHSTFPFENQNRFLLNLKHSPARIIPQISQRFLSFQKIQSFPEQTRISPRVQNFCSSLFDRNLKFFTRTPDCVLLGKGKNHILSRQELLILQHDVDACWSYDKMIYSGVRYVTALYHQEICKKSNDSNVCLKSGQIGKIVNIYKISYEGQEQILILINLYHIENDFLSNRNVTVQHIRKCSTVDNLQLFTPTDLLRPCLHMKTEKSEYVIVIPYGCDRD
ncbi:uncharacterized protein LOC122859546 isoform X2 [Aphidius gifuensis]|nr:uncharacterized protein LOC122859546 isoform X2 [Aphidius gifuensis]